MSVLNQSPDPSLSSPSSLWEDTATAAYYPALDRDLTVDVCVVGAGIAGLTAAYLLVRAGRSVAVIDRAEIGGNQTRLSTAHLASALDDRFYELERLHGERGARLAAESHAAAIDFIAATCRGLARDCDFARVDAYLFAAPDRPTDELERELAAARRAGLVVEWAERAPLRGFDSGRCLRFADQAQFHPLRYALALADAIVERGGGVFAHTAAEHIAATTVATANGHTIRSQHLLVASNVPINNRVIMHTKLEAYRSYVIVAEVAKDSVPLALYWDTGDPYHYLRVQRGATADLLIVGGEDHKTGQEDRSVERFARLEDWMRARFPAAGGVRYRWSGQIIEPVDGLAYLGRNPHDDDQVYIVTGDSGNGLTHGTIGGLLVHDLVCGTASPYRELYRPSRMTLRALGEYAQHNAQVAAQYASWISGGDGTRIADIPAGAGAVIHEGLHKIAAYRDENGTLHRHSAVCPHLGCIVAWNHNERTWDCPCHGSRFSCMGGVLNGPANEPLAPDHRPPSGVGGVGVGIQLGTC